MPENYPRSDADRAQQLYINTRLRKGGQVTLLPEDLLEGGGDLLEIDSQGRPLGADGTPVLLLVGPENPDGWHPYLGTAAEGVNGPTKQTSSERPINRNSWMGNQPMIRGDLPPSDLAAARIERPEAPLLVADSAGIEGFAASTETFPYFAFYTFVRNARHSPLSPATLVPPVANGQSIRVTLPTDIPVGVTGVGIWLTEPGSSTATTPGRAYLQHEVDVSRYNPGIYELTGPFRFEKAAPAKNETLLPIAAKPFLRFSFDGKASRPGTYQAVIVWTDQNGETLPGPPSQSVVIVPSNKYTDDEGKPIAGFGGLALFRPADAPVGATGWRPYIFVDGQWNVVYDSYRAWGNEVPYPVSTKSVTFSGWTSASDSEFSQNERIFLVSREIPTTNTSGVVAPTEALEEPVVFGVVRLSAGTYFAGITETVRGRESILSPTSSITISANQTLRIIRRDHVNLIPNGEHIELGADGRPLDRTYVLTGGTITGVAGDLVLQTSASTSGTTPSATTLAADIDPTEGGFVEVHMVANAPPVGVFLGSVETVLQEIADTGVVTETVLGTLSAPGEELIKTTLLPPP